MAVIDGDVDGVLAGLIKFKLLDVDDEVADEKVRVVGNHYVERHIDAGHDELSVFIDEIHFYFVGAFLDAVEGEAKGDGALRVDGGELAGDDGVERAEQIEFAVVVRGRVAKHRNLNGHTAGGS